MWNQEFCGNLSITKMIVLIKFRNLLFDLRKPFQNCTVFTNLHALLKLNGNTEADKQRLLMSQDPNDANDAVRDPQAIPTPSVPADQEQQECARPPLLADTRVSSTPTPILYVSLVVVQEEDTAGWCTQPPRKGKANFICIVHFQQRGNSECFT